MKRWETIAKLRVVEEWTHLPMGPYKRYRTAGIREEPGLWGHNQDWTNRDFLVG